MIANLLDKARESAASLTTAALVSTMAAAGSAASADTQQKVNMRQYCQAAATGNPADVHQQMDPYTDPFVEVTLDSNHGQITMNFNCISMIPHCPTQTLLPSGAAISMAHAGLGDYNATDPASARRTMETLSRNFNILDPTNKDTQLGADHLAETHGMPIVTFSNGESTLAPNGIKISKACIDRLNLGN